MSDKVTFWCFFYIAALCIFFAGFGTARLMHEKVETIQPTATTAINAQEAKIAAYLRSVGGLYPELIAQVCMDTTMPEMCAAVAMVESTANPYTLPGDAGESRGGWQVQNRHWRHFVGNVSYDPATQAQQWQAVMDFLLRSKSLPGAVFYYNGGSSRYVAKVYGHYLQMK